MAVIPQFTSNIFIYLLLCSATLGTIFQGVQSETESEGPSESECRPYIEKALKKLETGDTPIEVADENANLASAEDETDSSLPTGEVLENEVTEESLETKEQTSTEEQTETADATDVGDASKEDQTKESVEVDQLSSETEATQQEEEKSDNISTEQSAEEATTENLSHEETTEQDQPSNEQDDTLSVEEAAQSEETAQSLENTEEQTESQEKPEESAETDQKSLEQADSTQSAEQKDEVSAEQTEETAQASEQSEEAAQSAEQTEEAAQSAEQESTEQDTVQSAEQDSVQSAEQDIGQSAEQDTIQSVEDDNVQSAEQTDGQSEEQDTTQSTEQDASQSTEQADENVQSTEKSDEVVQSTEQTEETAQSTEQTEEAAQSTEQTEEVAHSTEQTEEDAQSTEQTEEVVQSTEQTEEAAQSVEDAQSVEAAQSIEDAQSIEVAQSTEQTEEAAQSTEQTEEVVQSTEQSAEAAQSTEETEEATQSTEQTEEVAQSTEKTEETAQSAEQTKQSAEGPQSVETDQSNETVKDTEETVEKTEDNSESVEQISETETPPQSDSEIEDLTFEFEIPTNLRPRQHITEILHLNEEPDSTELLTIKAEDVVLKDLKRLYENAIKPLEVLYKYRDLSNRHFGDPEIYSKPLVLFMGPWSGGKSSIVNYLLDNEFRSSSLRTGAEPSPAYFNIVMHGEKTEVLDGTQLAADWTFSGLQKFGQGLEERLRGLKMPKKLLEKVNIVEIPGILEVRKQVSRIFPFNDVCQWFIDRADIIFLVYDPSKLDVGPETEAILDQLKGREYQTRIILNKADQVHPEELMRVQGALIWNISPLMSSANPPVMYSTSLWSKPYEIGAPVRLLDAQERAFLKDLKNAIDKRIENKIASARRFAVRVRNHAKMVDCYLTTYYNHKSVFGNKKMVADQIIDHPQEYHIYEGLSTLTNISRYDLPDPEVYRDFFKLNPLYDFQQLSATCTYFRGCPINKLDIAIAYDLPELVGKYKKMIDQTEDSGNKNTVKS